LIKQKCWNILEGLLTPSLMDRINPGLKARVTEGRDGVWTPSLCPAGTHPGLKPGVSLASMKEITTRPNKDTVIAMGTTMGLRRLSQMNGRNLC
jgi:hypothetical protein